MSIFPRSHFGNFTLSASKQRDAARAEKVLIRNQWIAAVTLAVSVGCVASIGFALLNGGAFR